MDLSESSIEQPIIAMVDNIMGHAVSHQVSDIHWEPFADSLRVRMRHDGLLNLFQSYPKHYAKKIISRLKVLAELNIAEKRLPQDGHFSWQNNQGRHIDCRINCCPTIYGEKVVIRLLDSHNQQLSIDELGLLPEQQQLFLRAIEQPQGLILVTGPTGSGKTVTLYSGLSQLNQIERNISTIEDPVEIKVTGINQVSVNTKINLSFATALRAFLRQDPDVIMIGEMRDLETAEIAIKAAQTGHLVLSTLHTNSAAESITRLLNMGIPTYQIVNCFQLIIAQRLARRLCDHCKKASIAPDELGIEKVYQANQAGCVYCHQGYQGRIGIYEVISFNDEVRQALLKQQGLSFQQWLKQQNILNLHQAAMEKVKQGLTSLEEIYRITICDDIKN